MRVQNMRSLSYRIASVTCALRRENRERKSAERVRGRKTYPKRMFNIITRRDTPAPRSYYNLHLL